MYNNYSQQNMVQNPFNHPVQINHNFSAFGNRNVNQVVGLTISEIQQKLNANAARTQLFNVMSVNYYNNPDFMQLVVSIIEYAEALVFGEGANEQTAINVATGELCAIMASIIASSDQNIMNSLTQEQRAQTANGINMFNTIQNKVNQFKGGNMNNFNNQQGFPPQGQHGYPPQGFPPQGHQGYPPQQTAPQGMAMSGGGFFQQNNNTQATQVASKHIPNSFVNKSKGVTMSDYKANQHAAGDLDWQMNQVQPTRAEMMEVDTNTLNFPEDNSTYPQPQPQAETIELQQGVQLVPLNDLDIKPGKDGVPRMPLYNKDTHCCLLMLHNEMNTNGEWITKKDFVVMTKEEAKTHTGVDMDYNQHSLAMGINSPMPNDGEKVVPNWAPLYNDNDKQVASKEDGIEYKDEIISVSTNIISSDDNYARLEVSKRLANRSGVDVDDKILEYSYIKVTPFIVSGDKDVTEEFFERVKSSTSIDKYVKHVRSMVEKGLDKRLLSFIIVKSTEALNRILSKRMQVTATVDNILEDWYELKEWFEHNPNLAPGQGLALLSELEDCYKEVVFSTKLLSDKQREDFFKKEELDKEEFKGKFENLFLLGEVIYASRVPWTANDLPFAISSSGSEVKDSVTPEFYKAIDGLVERSSKVKDISQIHLLLADGNKLELDSGLFAKGYYVISSSK